MYKSIRKHETKMIGFGIDRHPAKHLVRRRRLFKFVVKVNTHVYLYMYYYM